MAADIPIIDAHIHLYPQSEIETLAWCKPDNPLHKQKSLDEYKAASSGSKPKGFIFVETDRKHDLDAGAKDGSGWKYPLMEVSWLKRIIAGQPRDGEGHSPEDASLCAAYIPWAPLPSGADVMEKYIELVKKEAGESWSKVRGFRYLLQDKPNGTMLEDKFIDSLKLLGRKGLVFDLGVDQHNRGRTQLEEVVEMIDRAHEGVPEDEKVVFIINHMCKPDLTVYNTQTDTSFIAWRTAIFTLSKCSKTYMKLSGGFPEMPDSLKQRPAEDIFDALMPWMTILVAAFGASRIMFASDWPVCTVGVGEDEGWAKWKKIVERLCWMASFEDEEKRMIWGDTAVKAYGIEQ
ncbi:amidohydrolase [Xylariaceae sp. FL0016]|nr:amidohydrolase [Xylariaceae sp. FL0016]